VTDRFFCLVTVFNFETKLEIKFPLHILL